MDLTKIITFAPGSGIWSTDNKEKVVHLHEPVHSAQRCHRQQRLHQRGERREEGIAGLPLCQRHPGFECAPKFKIAKFEKGSGHIFGCIDAEPRVLAGSDR